MKQGWESNQLSPEPWQWPLQAQLQCSQEGVARAQVPWEGQLGLMTLETSATCGVHGDLSAKVPEKRKTAINQRAVIHKRGGSSYRVPHVETRAGSFKSTGLGQAAPGEWAGWASHTCLGVICARVVGELGLTVSSQDEGFQGEGSGLAYFLPVSGITLITSVLIELHQT